MRVSERRVLKHDRIGPACSELLRDAREPLAQLPALRPPAGLGAREPMRRARHALRAQRIGEQRSVVANAADLLLRDADESEIYRRSWPSGDGDADLERFVSHARTIVGGGTATRVSRRGARGAPGFSQCANILLAVSTSSTARAYTRDGYLEGPTKGAEGSESKFARGSWHQASS